MTINFNTEPYYDDFDETKKFYRILFRPSYAVQARELTQLQSILQNQITKFGNHVFKEGAMVIPGEASIDTKVAYIKLEDSYGGVLADTLIESMVGLTVENATGLQAEVIYYAKSDGIDPPTLLVRYKNSDSDGTTKVFADGDVIADVDGVYNVAALASGATGKGSIASIKQGVYYIKNHFVLVEPQTIILDKYSPSPSYRIGLVCAESLITAEEDISLFDNAQNSFNYAAPGAHRYSIDAVLTKLAVDSTEDTDFIELIRTGDGQVKKEVRRTEYSVLEETFARRTYDESGNYTVKNFEIDVREYRNNDRGAWTSGRVYLIDDVVTNGGYKYVAKNSGTAQSSTPPTHTSGTVYDGAVEGVGTTGIQWEYVEVPVYNRGVYLPANSANLATNQANEAKLAIGLEPGKAYVQGYEIEKVATEYVTVNKSRDYVNVNSATIPTTVGNYVVVTNVNYLPPINTFGEVTIYDRVTASVGVAPSGATAIGTARVRLLEWDNGVIGTQAAQYKLGLFDVKMNGNYDFARKAKSFYFAGGSAAVTFTADIQPVATRLFGSATASSSTTITGNGTSFQTDLTVGDYISFNGTLRRVTAIASQLSLTVDSSISVTGSSIDRVSTEIKEPENTTLIFPLPNYAIKDVRAVDGTTNDTIYTVYQQLASATISAGAISPPSLASGVFASSADADNYIVINATTGVIIPITGTITGTGTNSISIPVSSSYNGNSAIVIAAVNKSGATLTEKKKTLQSGATAAFTTEATARAAELKLGKADGYRLVSVKMKSGTFSSPGSTYSIDITDRYDFDSGQRSTHYDLARVVLKNSYAPPEAPIQVTFDYFTHDAGDYFTKNSYPSNVDYKAIPFYTNIPLRDSFDFRPRINDEGTSFSDSVGNNGVPALVPKRGIDITTDYSYYLSRKTKIAVDFGGDFFGVDGVSSLNPGEPLDPALGLVLYGLELEPYTFGTSDGSVRVTRVDNKRYTMRDIGKLEKRIDNLEYYTSLSLLEQQTESLNVTDSEGETRFKNGFIVDNFAGHNTGDVSSSDYFCAIDMENAELRPFFSMQNINLIENASDAAARTAGNYQLYGDVITLPKLADIPLITQAYASRLENINPFAVFTFLGDVKINPSSDDWFEVDRRPDLVIDIEGNFNTIKRIAEKSGVLGTIWNSWQNQWTGASVTTTTYGGKYGALAQQLGATGQKISTNTGVGLDTSKHGWAYKAGDYTITTTTATQIGQSRTGVKTTLVAKIDKQIVGDRVLSTAAIPYIRSRNILVQIQKLKPLTRFYPFFDGVDISSYCTPASKIVYTPTGSTAAAKQTSHNNINTEANVGLASTETARRINGDSQVCLNKGDVITGGTSGATAVVVGKEYNPDTGVYSLFVVNTSGSFTSDETITGSISAATGTFGSITAGSQGGNLVSNFNGEVHLLFNIPNTDSVRFRCGTRELKLVDVATADGEFTSRARANYRAEGVLESRQQTVHSVRNAELVEERLVDNRVITQTSERVVSGTAWYDPLAQTFLIDQKGGCFLSKVDVFFATKDPKIPVTLEIREVVNGYPGKRILPFSRVTLKPEQVSLSNNTVTLDDVLVKSYDTPTSFTFPSPVYVQEGVEYAIVLASDSNQYKVWVSQVGEIMPGTARTISEQPYLGSLFKSQNASTWTADQTQDLKFTIYRAQFDTSVVSNVEYVNDAIPMQTLDTDPFEIKSGVTTVRVWHANHGMPSGSKVTISGVGATLNGVPAAQFNTTHDISNVDLDSYTITVSTSPTSSGYAGGTAVKATRNFQFDAIQPSIAIQSFSETPVSFGFKATTGKSVDSSGQSPYVDPETLDFEGILANETNYFSVPKMVASEVNEAATAPNGLGGSKSLAMNVVMLTTNDALSPILDTHRTSLIAISNKVNHPTQSNMNVANLDYNTILSANTTVFFAAPTLWTASASMSTGANIYYGSNQYIVTVGGTSSTTPPTHTVGSVLNGTVVLKYQGPVGGVMGSANSTAKAALATLTVGKYVTISGASNSGNNGTFLIKAVATDGATVTLGSTMVTESATSAITLIQRERFVEENAPLNSSGYSKYVTKRVNLANPSTMLRVKFAVNLPAESDVEVWYKTASVGTTTSWELQPYVQMTADTPIANYSNSTGNFVDASFSAENLDSYDAVTVKLVMKSTNTAEVPRIKDLRVLALV